MDNTHSQAQAVSLTEIRLYGPLRKEFGKSYWFAIRTAAEGIRALCITVPGFRQYLSQHSAPGYRVWLDKDPIQDVKQEMYYPAGKLVRVVPVVAGAKNASLGSIILGIGLITLAVVFPGFAPFLNTSLSAIAFNVGISLVLGGVASLLFAPPKKAAPTERPENQPSYTFNGPVNTIGQGNAVPILLGRLRVGGQVISAGLSTSQLGSSTSLTITWPILKA